jgi:ribosomal protein S18 acetylase RimI-like enzyme
MALMDERSRQSLLSRVVIRPAVRQDLPGLEWGGELIHYRRLFAEIFRQKVLGLGLMWVVELQEVGIIGQLFVHLNSPRVDLADGKNRAYVYGFRVRTQFQGQGLGTKLMEVVEKDLRQRGFGIVNLNVSLDNEGALRLYKRLGYRVLGHDPGQWSYVNHLGRVIEVDEPAWRMQKDLTAESESGFSI